MLLGPAIPDACELIRRRDDETRRRIDSRGRKGEDPGRSPGDSSWVTFPLSCNLGCGFVWPGALVGDPAREFLLCRAGGGIPSVVL